MLRLEGLTCGYGRMVAVRDLDLDVGEGQVVALLGANGAGKSSTLRAILGQVVVFDGRVWLAGDDITALATARRAAAGIALAPEGRRLFADLTVAENLAVGAFSRPSAAAARQRAEVLDLFPRIGERLEQRAGSLSGGEQQMLAIGR
ncbi:MAG: ATP-binding cassette domain-containing protein, partial [Kiloniellales bacterium]